MTVRVCELPDLIGFELTVGARVWTITLERNLSVSHVRRGGIPAALQAITMPRRRPRNEPCLEEECGYQTWTGFFSELFTEGSARGVYYGAEWEYTPLVAKTVREIITALRSRRI